MTWTQTVSEQQNAYKQNSFQTASRGELTLMLYNGCLKFIQKAATAMEANDKETRHINLTKAQKIVRELMVTLKVEDETGKQMMQLYDFTLSQLISANIENDEKALAQAKEIIVEFRDTWKEVIQRDREHRYRKDMAN